MKTINFSLTHQKFLKKEKKHKAFVISTQLGVLLAFVLVWEISAQLEIIDAFLMSSPSRMFSTLVMLIQSGQLWPHMLISTYETIVGFFLGTLIGTAIAITMWWSKTLREIFQPYIVVLNSLPKIALGPIIIIWVGIGQAAIITMSILISFIITTISMLSGFLETSQEKTLLLQTMTATKFQIFTKLVFPANIPTLLSTLKINVGLAWVGTIMGEYLVSRAGLGYLIVYGGQVFKLDLVMTCTLILCVLAGGMYFFVALLEKKLVKWKN